MRPATLTLEPDVQLPEISERRLSLQDCQSPNKEVKDLGLDNSNTGVEMEYKEDLFSQHRVKSMCKYEVGAFTSLEYYLSMCFQGVIVTTSPT